MHKICPVAGLERMTTGSEAKHLTLSGYTSRHTILSIILLYVLYYACCSALKHIEFRIVRYRNFANTLIDNLENILMAKLSKQQLFIDDDNSVPT